MKRTLLIASVVLILVTATLVLAAEAEEKPTTPEQDLINFRAGYHDGCLKAQKSLGKSEKYQIGFCACMMSVLGEVPEADLKALAKRVAADPAAAADPAFLEKLQQLGAADCALVGQFDDTKTLSKEDLARLGDPKALDGFSIRLPRGFMTLPVRQQGPVRLFAFSRLHGDLETVTVLQVTLIDINPPPPKPSTAQDRQQVRAMFLRKIAESRTEWTLSEPSEVVIGDLVFAAADWAGKNEGKAQGTLYAAVTDKQIVMLLAQDVQPFAGDTIPLAKEVFRSFSLH